MIKIHYLNARHGQRGPDRYDALRREADEEGTNAAFKRRLGSCLGVYKHTSNAHVVTGADRGVSTPADLRETHI